MISWAQTSVLIFEVTVMRRGVETSPTAIIAETAATAHPRQPHYRRTVAAGPAPYGASDTSVGSPISARMRLRSWMVAKSMTI